jgi:hypothetical protein
VYSDFNGFISQALSIPFIPPLISSMPSIWLGRSIAMAFTKFGSTPLFLYPGVQRFSGVRDLGGQHRLIAGYSFRKYRKPPDPGYSFSD